MKLQILTVKDRATDEYGNPMFLVSIGQAVRSFGDEVNRQDPQNNLYNHPDDYDLYHLGTYDTANAKFEMLENPERVATGTNVKK